MLYTALNIDKVFTSYMVSHKVEALGGFRRIEQNEIRIEQLREAVNDHEFRLGALEGRKRLREIPGVPGP